MISNKKKKKKRQSWNIMNKLYNIWMIYDLEWYMCQCGMNLQTFTVYDTQCHCLSQTHPIYTVKDMRDKDETRT